MLINDLIREERRNATKLYHPMRLGDVANIAPIVNWTYYVNNILTEAVGVEVGLSLSLSLSLSCRLYRLLWIIFNLIWFPFPGSGLRYFSILFPHANVINQSYWTAVVTS